MASLLQTGLVSPRDVWVSQSGDYPHEEVLSTMDPGLLRLLQDHHYKNMTAVGAGRSKACISVSSTCHMMCGSMTGNVYKDSM